MSVFKNQTKLRLNCDTNLSAADHATLTAQIIKYKKPSGATGSFTATAGTAALPAITTTGDTNTGMFFPAADTIAFAEGGTEVIRINSSGNVGIGTTSPSSKLHVKDSTGNAVKLLHLETAWNSPSGNKSIDWTDATNTLGSSFILNHPTLGKLGVQVPQPYLGDSRGAWSVIYSGGDT
mgnify:CR=1 FL=1